MLWLALYTNLEQAGDIYANSLRLLGQYFKILPRNPRVEVALFVVISIWVYQPISFNVHMTDWYFDWFTYWMLYPLKRILFLFIESHTKHNPYSYISLNVIQNVNNVLQYQYGSIICPSHCKGPILIYLYLRGKNWSPTIQIFTEDIIFKMRCMSAKTVIQILKVRTNECYNEVQYRNAAHALCLQEYEIAVYWNALLNRVGCAMQILSNYMACKNAIRHRT